MFIFTLPSTIKYIGRSFAGLIAKVLTGILYLLLRRGRHGPAYGRDPAISEM
jgi:hypothetical protein